MPTPNYGFAKRQKELAKKQRKEAKRQRKSQSEEATPTAKPEPLREDLQKEGVLPLSSDPQRCADDDND